MDSTGSQSKQAWIEKTLQFIKNSGAKNIALSGGNTPIALYEAMNKAGLNSEEYHYFQTDERYVLPDNPLSNQRMIRETLNPRNFTSFDTTLKVSEAIKDYQQNLQPLDLCILGVGTDGHIASLFPNGPELNTTEPVTNSTTEKFEVYDRLTLSFLPILASKKILILLGPGKEAVLKELQNPSKNHEDFPAIKLLTHSDITIYSYS